MDAIIGCIVLVAALSLLVGCVVWSRHTINLIADRNLHAVRDIMRELRSGR